MIRRPIEPPAPSSAPEEWEVFRRRCAADLALYEQENRALLLRLMVARLLFWWVVLLTLLIWVCEGVW